MFAVSARPAIVRCPLCNMEHDVIVCVDRCLLDKWIHPITCGTQPDPPRNVMILNIPLLVAISHSNLYWVSHLCCRSNANMA